VSTEDKAVVGVALMVLTLAISIPWSIAWYHTTVIKSAMEAGYEQQTLQGQVGVHWVKANPINE